MGDEDGDEKGCGMNADEVTTVRNTLSTLIS